MKYQCNHCDQPATYHSIEIIKGQRSESHLCDTHAGEAGIAEQKYAHTPINELLTKFIKASSQEIERKTEQIHYATNELGQHLTAQQDAADQVYNADARIKTDRLAHRIDYFIPSNDAENGAGDLEEYIAKLREDGVSEKIIRKKLRRQMLAYLWPKYIQPLLTWLTLLSGVILKAFK